MALDIPKRLRAYLEILAFIAVGVWGAILVLLEILTFQKGPKDILNPPKLIDRIFGKVWLRIDKVIAAGELETNLPALINKAYGTVLEVGPGSGNQLPRYDVSRIDRIYGVEPNPDLHDALRATIKQHGLSDVYTIVPCGVEDSAELAHYGIRAGSVDTVTSVQVLCSVPQPAEMAGELYRLLKPGGQMVVYEHVESEDWLSRRVQGLYTTVWPYVTGHCRLNRPTGKYLLEAGSWSTIELETPKEEDAWMLFPHVSGRLVKWGAGAK
ncbi:MAG: hypothetical protein ASARMPREDX12_008052 [Alectoria sarmentosa]|nr:MAG: hypothetical protein ASARMPREDX12_008052 [Alectoria sarmentosa]